MIQSVIDNFDWLMKLVGRTTPGLRTLIVKASAEQLHSVLICVKLFCNCKELKYSNSLRRILKPNCFKEDKCR